MILKATSSIIIFILNLVYFLNCVSGDCSPVVTGPACPDDGWEETPHPKSCIKLIHEKKYAGQDAYKACVALDPPHSSTWMSYNKAQNEHLTKYIERTLRSSNPWIGLNDHDEENKWMWTNGQELRVSEAEWGKTEPNGARTQQCVYVGFNRTWIWVDDFCDTKRHVVCQTRHLIGPREINMTLEYHAPKRGRHIIYRDTPLKHTCSAFLSEGDDDLWLKDTNTNSDDTETRSQNQENSLGMCTKRTFRTWSAKVNVPWFEKSYKVDCFTRKIDEYDTGDCGDQPAPNSFCKTFTFPSVFIDPPEEKPIIAISDAPNNKVWVNCTVNVGETGELTWVIFMTSEPKILQPDDFYIRHGSRVEGEKKNRWVEKSSLLLPLKSKVGGAIIACFDHNITRYSFTTTCDPEDLFCASIKMIKVTGRRTSSSSTFPWLLLFGLLLIILLSIVVAILVCQRQPAAARQDDEEEERPVKADEIKDGAQEETPVIAEVEKKEGSLVDGDKQSLQSKESRRSSKNSDAKSAAKSAAISADGGRQSTQYSSAKS